jgi:hypothetical protein
MITIVEANSKKLLRKFVLFPFTLYKDHPYWVPTLINDELKAFDKKENPVFEHADARFFLAYKDGSIVGRIAAIINWQEVNILQKNKMRFGWYDVMDDIEVSRALIEKVIEIGKQNKLDHIEGPLGFSNLDKVGVITEGYDYSGNMITWYNYPYYKTHLELLQFTIEKEYIESKFPFSNVDPNFFLKANELIRKRYELHTLNFDNTKQIMPYVDDMFQLFNTTYNKLASFVEVSPKQIAYFKKKYIGLINPEYIKFVMDKENRMVAFSIVMPDYSEALRKSKGKLFPFGFFHFIKEKKENKTVLFYLIGIEESYQNKGITALIFSEYYNTFQKNKITTCLRTPELAENTAIHSIWKHFNPIIHRKRCTYKKEI